jgi:uncharacterized repeat protein (TIGR01451 family)
MSLIALMSMFLANLASAHSITVDGAISTDWISAKGPRANSAHIVRDTSGRGEVIWNDTATTATKIGDERIASASPTAIYTRSVDLEQVRVTGDATNLNIIVALNFVPTLNVVGTSKAPQIQIAIDTGNGANNTSLVDPKAGVPVSTTVSTSAAWEYLLQTQFQSSAPATRGLLKIYTTPVASTTGGTVNLSVSPGNYAEMSIPWSAIGGKPAVGARLRFTVATLLSDGTIPADGAGSKVLDATSPVVTGGTLAEVQDGVIDGNNLGPAYFDATFNTAGDVYAPLVVSEFVPLPSWIAKAGTPLAGLGPKQAGWVEIANAGTTPVQLNGYKVGDETTRGGSEGMYNLPNISLPAGQVIVIARNAGAFKDFYYAGANPSFTVYSFTSTDSNALSQYTKWGTGTFDFKTAATTSGAYSDEVVVLDASDAIVDVLQYVYDPANPASKFYPDQTSMIAPAAGITADTDYQRCPATRDTNDATLDVATFGLKTDVTPGIACANNTVELGITKTGPTVATPATQVDYALHYSNTGVGATDVIISDTLPTGFVYVSEASVPAITASTPDGTNPQMRKWLVSKLNQNASGVITVTVTLPATPGTFTNQAEIKSGSVPPQPESVNSNNTSSVTTDTTQNASDVQVTKTLLNPDEAYPGGQAIYQIGFTNTGNQPATGVTIADTFPAGLSYASNDGGYTTSGTNPVTFNIGTVPVGESKTFNVTFNVTEGASGSLQNNVVIAATSLEINSNNTASSQNVNVPPKPPIDLSITKNGPATVALNGVLKYTITVTNKTGVTQTATGIAVTDDLPAGLSYVAGSTTDGAGEPSVSGSSVSWTLPASFDLAPGASKSFTFQTKLSGSKIGDTIINSATVLGGGATEPAFALSNNSSTSNTATVGQTKLFLSLIKH